MGKEDEIEVTAADAAAWDAAVRSFRQARGDSRMELPRLSAAGGVQSQPLSQWSAGLDDLAALRWDLQ